MVSGMEEAGGGSVDGVGGVGRGVVGLGCEDWDERGLCVLVLAEGDRGVEAETVGVPEFPGLPEVGLELGDVVE